MRVTLGSYPFSVAFLRRKFDDPSVPWFVIGLLTFAGAWVAYRAVRRGKDFDAGAVSEDWLQHHRIDPKDY